jgi:ubiquinone/menaquinone biosynthesis C-methylase UbiE
MILGRVLALFFRELYTHLAWAYDAVAVVVSLGEWFHWQQVAYHSRITEPVLEIGFGTGHVQTDLAARGWAPVGIDRSAQMTRISRRRIAGQGSVPRLVQADAKALPFAAGVFQSALSTFPSEYLFDPVTLEEARRVLLPGGRLVVIPMAVITSPDLIHRLAAWLFRVTGQAGPIPEGWTESFRAAGFTADLETVRLRRSEVVRIVAVAPAEDHS